MADPMNALLSLQEVVAQGNLENLNPQRCKVAKGYQMIFESYGRIVRFSYAKIVTNEVRALSMFATAQPINGVPCYNIGYAVATKYRGKGLGLEAVTKGIEELSNGFRRTNITKLFLEAVIDESNTHSISIAIKVFGNSGTPTTDSISGKPALAFQKLITF